MATTRWCIDGPLYGQEAPPTAFGQFVTENTKREKVTYYPNQATVKGTKREYFATGPSILDDVIAVIVDLDAKAMKQAHS